MTTVKTESLLDKAKKIKMKRNLRVNQVDKDQLADLAIAWAKEEVGTTQVSKSLGLTDTNVYNYLAMGFRQAVQLGKLTVKK